MIYLEKLLDVVDVEWKTLKDALERTKGTNITASQMKELNKDGAPLKIFAGGKTIAFVNYEDIPSKDVNRLPSIIVKSRGVIEFEYYDKPFTHKNEMWSYHSNNPELDIKFVYYYLKIQEPYFQNIAGRMQMPQISIPDTDKYKIPIPPIEIQQKIVAFLDKFTELSAELRAELRARKKQYAHYRDMLLSFRESEVEWNIIENVFEIVAGGDVPKDSFSEIETEDFNVPILSNGIESKSLYGWTNIPKVKMPSLTISARGTIGWTSYREKPFFPIVRLIVLTPKIELNLKYAYYYMKMIENDYNIPQNGIPQLTKPMIKSISFPIPSLAEQNRIVSILDKFDTLTTSISEGLPKEIELRKKQYEYYRDMLLSFPK